MSEEISVTIPSGGCTNCTECGLCGKGKKSDVITDSIHTPAEGDRFTTANGSVIAVDLGTTTIAMYRLDEKTGEQLGVFVSLNPQQIHGDDVISRICAATNGNAKELQELVLSTIENGIHKVAKEEPSLVVVAGNTVMQYLLLGIDSSELGVYPFRASFTMQQETQIAGIRTIVMPGLSAFIGGDIMAGLKALDFQRKERVAILIDLGTNGEMVIGNKNRMLATSAAAGPAFDNKVYGTRLIAGIASLLQQGIIDETGCLNEEFFDTGIKVMGSLITQKDIRGIQQAKAAIRSGIEILLMKYGCKATDVEEIYLSGGFGFYLNLDAAFTIGLFPKEFLGKITVSGNTSLEGAYRYVMQYVNPNEKSNAEAELSYLKEMITELNLAEQEEFNDMFIAQMNF